MIWLTFLGCESAAVGLVMSQFDDAVADQFYFSTIDANVRGDPVVILVKRPVILKCAQAKRLLIRLP